jgi:hypothetical protein
MSDLLAAAITARPPTQTRAVVAEVAPMVGRNYGAATAVTIGSQTLSCTDECHGWVHEPGDAVAVQISDGVVRVTGSLEDRPSVGTVTSVASGFARVADDDGALWWAAVLPGQTVTAGDQVTVMWTGAGGVILPALVPVAIRASARPQPDPASELPGIIPDGPDPWADVTVAAVESGSHASGAWVRSGDSSRVEQGSPTGGAPAAGAWLYGDALDFLVGRSVTAASITVRRSTDPGIAASPVLMCHTARTTADTPDWVGTALTGQPLLPGQTATIDLTPELLAPLVAGTAHGLGIVGADWCRLDGITTTALSGQLHLTTV